MGKRQATHERGKKKFKAEAPMPPLESESEEETSPITTNNNNRSNRTQKISTKKQGSHTETLEDLLGNSLSASSESEGEDIINDMEKDYREDPEQDKYDFSVLDERRYKAIDPQSRMAAEAEMKKREKSALLKKGIENLRDQNTSLFRVPLALQLVSDDEDDLNLEDGPLKIKKKKRNLEIGTLEIHDQDQDIAIDLEDRSGSLREYISLDGPRLEIGKRFRNFLASFQKNEKYVYRDRISQMCIENSSTLEVSFTELSSIEPLVATWLGDAPAEMLKIFDEISWALVLEAFPEYVNIAREIHVRIIDLPICDSLREIRQIHLNSLLKVRGVVTRRTSVFPQLLMTKYNCSKCGILLGPYLQESSGSTSNIKIGNCPNCQGKGPFVINTEETVYRNFQKMTLQESPGTVLPGRLPRTKEIILLADLIDKARPGEEIEVTGIYKNSFDSRLNSKHGFPVFSTIIEANYISKKSELSSSVVLTAEDEKKIKELAKDEKIGEKIINSIAPSIYGHYNIKTALTLSLLSGQSKENQEGHRIRGDINILLIGDPGTAKSQFLKYVEKTAHRAVYTTGQGASAVGLTASVRKDPLTREWSLEGGALVLADNGVCLIDEFDKMNDQDRTSIHEAMEQQSISISKAGIVTSLQARCAVIAAANPIKGRYDPSLSLAKNVNLTDPILSRFDIICVVKDIVDPVGDERLAEFVVFSHTKSHPDQQKKEEEEENTNRSNKTSFIPQDLLKKYIYYARKNIKPILNQIDKVKVQIFYSQLREKAQENGGTAITVRHLEGILRMAEASAKLHLREYVREDDINLGIKMTLESFISSQKISTGKSLRNHFRSFLDYNKDNNQILLYLLQTLVKEYIHFSKKRKVEDKLEKIEVPIQEFEARAKEMNINSFSEFYTSDEFSERYFKRDDKIIFDSKLSK